MPCDVCRRRPRFRQVKERLAVQNKKLGELKAGSGGGGGGAAKGKAKKQVLMH